MKKIIDYFQREQGVVFLIGVLLLVLVGIVDYLSGYNLSFSVFYLIPIILVGWFLNLQAALFLSLGSILIWMLADVMSRSVPLPTAILFWNAGVRFGFFFIISYLLNYLKSKMKQEQVLALEDFSTGISNSRHFYSLANRELQRLIRYGHIFTVLYIDVDNFKSVNDVFGHKEGDMLLKLVATTLENLIRKVDILARLGGDEFIILMPEINKDKILTIIDRIKKGLSEAMQEKHRTAVTFSMGCVTFIKPPSSVNEMIRLADDQMYTAKRNGKNQEKYYVFN